MRLAGKRAVIRKLWPGDVGALRRHLKRLDAQTRNMRFGGAVGDEFLHEYAQSSASFDGVVLGCFIDDTLRATGELRIIFETWPIEAELAFAVETSWQDKGIGRELFQRLMVIAQNRTVKTLHMICLPENARMQSLAKAFKSRLTIDVDQVEGTLDPAWPTLVSIAKEMLADSRSFVRAVLRL